MPEPAPTWRLIDTGPLPGPANMAIDEALLSCFDPLSSRPVLRLYGWDPPALSLGRFQDAADLKLPTAAADGIAVVRRMTGGGIIFHADELTYSIVCSPDQIAAAGVKEGFRRLCGFLLGTYRGLGLDPAFAADRNPGGARLGERTPFCFAGKEEFDVVVDGRKIGGNAQRRLRRAILQHGSIPLQNRVQDALRYLQNAAPAAADAVSLADLGLSPALPELKRLLVASFEGALGVRLLPDRLDDRELRAAAELERQKYASSCWSVQGEAAPA